MRHEMIENRPETERRSRNPERSRNAILDAAEALFAERGYDATSLKDVGERAEVSRGTPAYFHGSKEGLYQAVIDRVFAQTEALVHEAQARALAKGGGLEALLSEMVGGYVDFLVAHPNFIRLVERETLSGGKYMARNPPHLAAVQAGLAAAQHELEPGVDPVQVLLSVMGLCWFSVSHARILQPALGIDTCSPEFVEARKRHIVELLLNGLLPR